MRSVALTRQALPFALALLAGALLVPTPSRGVTLGNIASQSGLGQPLRVVIPVAVSSGEVLNAECLKLVADDSSGVPQIVAGRIALENGAHPRLVVTTATSVNEPAIRLAVQVGCGSTSRRDYALMLDPPALGLTTAVASNDADETAWVAVQEPPTSRPSANPSADSGPSTASRLSSWGTPVATGPALPAHSASQVSSSTIVEAKSIAPVAASVPLKEIAPRELANFGSGALISEAAAAPLPSRPATSLPQPASRQSIPLVSRPQARPSAAMTVWQENWQYAAVGAGVLVLGVGAFIVRQRAGVAAHWFSKTDRIPLKGETQAGPAMETLASFEQMSGPASTRSRSPTVPRDPPPDQTVHVAELDTIMEDIQSDLINEQTVKDAWKAAATEAAMDIGTDSILKAIAAAERDLQIGASEAHFVMDTDELTIPNPQAKPKTPAEQG